MIPSDKCGENTAIAWKIKQARKEEVSKGHSALSGPVRDTPPYRAIPFRDRIAEGVSHAFCLVFIGYRASIAEIPLLGGKAKSGNLNLFLGILLFFPSFSLQFSRKKGQNTQKKV